MLQNALHQERGEKDLKGCWDKDTALFDATVYVKWL